MILAMAHHGNTVGAAATVLGLFIAAVIVILIVGKDRD